MKRLIFSIIGVTLLFFPDTVVGNDNISNRKEFKIQINKEFPITPDGTVSLTNKYGDIRIISSNDNEVRVEVEITVFSSSQSKADKVFDKINIKFSSDPGFVSVKTEIEKSKSLWGFISSDKNDYRIDYYVELPRTVKLELSHKYGDIFGDDRNSDVDISLKYGNVNMGIIGGNLNLSCGYGKAIFVSADNLDVKIDYSTLKINKIKDAKCVSKYSKIIINQSRYLSIDSKYDNYVIGTTDRLYNVGKYDDFMIESIGVIDISTAYTNLSVGHLQDIALLKFKYGSIKIDHIAPSFKSIDLDSDYVGVTFGFDRKAKFKFDIHSSYAPVTLPQHYKYDNAAKYKYNFKGEGYAGSSSASSTLTVKMDYGSLKLIENKSDY